MRTGFAATLVCAALAYTSAFIAPRATPRALAPLKDSELEDMIEAAGFGRPPPDATTQKIQGMVETNKVMRGRGVGARRLRARGAAVSRAVRATRRPPFAGCS